MSVDGRHVCGDVAGADAMHLARRPRTQIAHASRSGRASGGTLWCAPAASSMPIDDTWTRAIRGVSREFDPASNLLCSA